MANKNAQPKVSVIIPVYNAEKYLRECLDCVTNQTLKDIEIICIDDGSVDSSPEILKEYAAKDDRIIILQQKNQGAAPARNRGLQEAKGKYLSFIDSDDIMDLAMLQKLYDCAENTSSDIVICHFQNIEKNGNIKIASYFPEVEKQTFGVPFSPSDLDVFNLTIKAAWNKLYNRNFVIAENLAFQNLGSANDVAFVLLSLATATKICYINDVLYTYRRYANNNISSTRGKHAENIVLAAEYIRQELIKRGLWEKLADNFYNSMLPPFCYEYHLCPFLKKNKLLQSYRKFLPLQYYNKEFKHTHPLRNLLFSKHQKDDKQTVCFLGIKITYRNIIYNRFIHHNIKNKSVLLVELNSYHGECLPGMAKYFLDLGYNVDVLLNKSEAKLSPFSKYFRNKISLFSASPKIIKLIVCSDIVEKYDFLYINTDNCNKQNISTYLEHIKYPAGKIITMHHDIKHYGVVDFNASNSESVFLADFSQLTGKKHKCINSHFYKEIKKHTKNNITKFIAVGNIEAHRKNHQSLINAVLQLASEGITDFKITIISRKGNLNLPSDIKKFFTFKENLSYPKMYNELENADFILTLFDTENPEHEKYITTKASGSYQLSYGFNIPVLIPHKFQTAINGFNNLNSIGYKNNNDLVNAMKLCINMKENNYKDYKTNLAKLEKEIYNSSLNNLKEITKDIDRNMPQDINGSAKVV